LGDITQRWALPGGSLLKKQGSGMGVWVQEELSEFFTGGSFETSFCHDRWERSRCLCGSPHQ
jgi:hypothetical protein